MPSGSVGPLSYSSYTEHFLSIVVLNTMYVIKKNQAMVIAVPNKHLKVLGPTD